MIDSTAPTGTKIKTNNIVSVTHNAIPGTGVVNVRIQVDKGIYIPDIDQDQLYASGADLVGVRQAYPIMITISLEDAAAADHVGTSIDDLVVTAKAAQSQANQVITCKNAARAKGQPHRASPAGRHVRAGHVLFVRRRHEPAAHRRQRCLTPRNPRNPAEVSDV